MNDNTERFQGILLKRRDVLRQIWRPRYFILENDGVMTYHLLSRTAGTQHQATDEQDSTILQSGINYDVAPRGTIYLASCEIEPNDRLTRPHENLYAFTITPPASSDSGPCFLATTTPESRDLWIQKLAASVVCQDEEQASVDGIESISDHPPPPEEKEVPWTNLIPPSRVLNGVPRRIVQRIENALARYLPLFNQNNKADCWKPLPTSNEQVTAMERRYNNCSMLLTTATIPHPPKQIFSLLVNCRRRRDFETNVRYDERLKEYNSHTFLDYYAYQAVWPTLARDFGVILHWRIMSREKGDAEERAICMIAFSDDAADELRPPASDHVRADLKVSLYLLQPTNDSNHCLVTRLLSYDFCGNVPKSLTSKVVQQQATMPIIITQHLSETEPDPPVWLTGGELTNESVEKDVIDRLSETKEDNNGAKRSKFAERGESLLLQEDASTISDENIAEDLPLTLTVALLLTPLLLWSFANSLDLPGKEAYFIFAALLAVRAVTLGNLGARYEASSAPPNVGKVTCRFSVDLKGVLRFIAKRKEEQEEEQIESTEVSVIHIVIGAIAVAMEEAEPLKCKRIYNPLIGIDGYYFSRHGGVDISLLVPSTEGGKQDDIYNLYGIGSMSVQSIADRIVEEQERLNEDQKSSNMLLNALRVLEGLASWTGLSRGASLGRCLVIASPDHSDQAEVDIDASPLSGSNVNVIVVVGGVRLVRDMKTGASPSGRPTSVNIKAPPKPTLSMSITIDCPICSVAASRRFAERVQQLVQFPEMCDD